MSDFVSRLHEAMAISGQTQRAIATAADLPHETISRILTRKSKNPSLETVRKLARALGVTVAWLLGEPQAAATPDEFQKLADALRVVIRRLTPELDARDYPNATPIGRGRAASALHGYRRLAALEPVLVPSEGSDAQWVFRAEGDSMAEAGILPGDSIFVRETFRIERILEDIVVFSLGDRWYVKHLTISDNYITLVSGNERYSPIRIAASDDFFLLGVVIARFGRV